MEIQKISIIIFFLNIFTKSFILLIAIKVIIKILIVLLVLFLCCPWFIWTSWLLRYLGMCKAFTLKQLRTCKISVLRFSSSHSFLDYPYLSLLIILVESTIKLHSSFLSCVNFVFKWAQRCRESSTWPPRSPNMYILIKGRILKDNIL